MENLRHSMDQRYVVYRAVLGALGGLVALGLILGSWIAFAGLKSFVDYLLWGTA